MKYYIILIIMTFLGSIASLLLKKAADKKNLKLTFFSRYLYLGGFLYFITAILNIYLLGYLDYTIVLPLTSLTYIWTSILSSMLLNEGISNQKVVGLFLIVTGAFFIV